MSLCPCVFVVRSSTFVVRSSTAACRISDEEPSTSPPASPGGRAWTVPPYDPRRRWGPPPRGNRAGRLGRSSQSGKSNRLTAPCPDPVSYTHLTLPTIYSV